jgi:hypothetical protein
MESTFRNPTKNRILFNRNWIGENSGENSGENWDFMTILPGSSRSLHLESWSPSRGIEERDRPNNKPNNFIDKFYKL